MTFSFITVVLGLMLGAGVILVAAPLTWPRKPARDSRPSRLQQLVRERLTQAELGRVSPAMVVVVSSVLALAIGALVLALLHVAALAVAATVVALVAPATVISWRA